MSNRKKYKIIISFALTLFILGFLLIIISGILQEIKKINVLQGILFLLAFVSWGAGIIIVIKNYFFIISQGLINKQKKLNGNLLLIDKTTHCDE